MIKNNDIYTQNSGAFYKKVQGGYLHASPQHYILVGRPNIGSMTDQIIGAINQVNNLNEENSALDKIIKAQQDKEWAKLEDFINVYNSSQTQDSKKIQASSPKEAVFFLNKLIKEQGFNTSNPYTSTQITDAVIKINNTIRSFFSQEILSSNSTVQNMNANDFMGLFEISEDIRDYLLREYQKEENEFIRELLKFPISKVKGFLITNNSLYNKYSQKNNKAPSTIDPTLNQILESIGGYKSWGNNRNARKTAAQVQISYGKSIEGGRHQFQGITLEKTLAGYLDASDIQGDVANLIKGLVEGKVIGKTVGGELDSFQKQQKIDIKWTFNTENEKQQIINLSSKLRTGSSGINIHSGGGLDSYIARFEQSDYSKPIADIFKNPNFRYFFANEYYGVASGNGIDTGFRNAIYNALKVNIPSLIGVEIEKNEDSYFGGVDFLNVNKVLIPVSFILVKMKKNLKDYKQSSRGMNIRINASDSGGNFLTNRRALLKTLNPVSPNDYYTDSTLMARGIRDMNAYANHIKIGIQLTSNLINQSIKEATSL